MDSSLNIDNSNKDSFVIYMCVSGKGVQLKGDNFLENLNYGATILVPSGIKRFEIIPVGYSELLEIYIS